MKIAVLLSRVPHPLDKGDKLRGFHFVRELSKEHEVSLICLCYGQEVSTEAELALKSICREVHFLNLSTWGLPASILMALLRGLPFQTAYFYRTGTASKIKRLLHDIKPDHVLVQLIRTAEYVKDLHEYPKTLDYMDAFGIGYERRAENSKFPARLFFAEEAARVRRYESRIFYYFDRHLIISGQDRIEIRHPENETISVIPNGVNEKYFAIEIAVAEPIVLFTGNMSYPPNEACALYLINEVMPLVWRVIPSAKLIVAGADPTRSLLAQQANLIEITGRIEDMSQAYQRAAVFAAPMALGSGLQNKLLEAMAAGLPCVTTTLCNRALGARPEKEILIGECTESSAQQIVRLLQNQQLRFEIGQAGRELVAHNFRWKNIAKLLLDALCRPANHISPLGQKTKEIDNSEQSPVN